ncbi:hypothetical protein MMC27_002001 [Xylographa pallens]|nr:hypothetical protein [Xylographa pallens]
MVKVAIVAGSGSGFSNRLWISNMHCYSVTINSADVTQGIIDVLVATEEHEILLLFRKDSPAGSAIHGIIWIKAKYETLKQLAQILQEVHTVHTVPAVITIQEDTASTRPENIINTATFSTAPTVFDQGLQTTLTADILLPDQLGNNVFSFSSGTFQEGQFPVSLGATGAENDFDLQGVDVALFNSLFRATEILDAAEEEIWVQWASRGPGK